MSDLGQSELMQKLQRLEAELQQLRCENAALRGAHLQAPVAQIDLDCAGRVRAATVRVAELLQLAAPEPLLGQPLSALFSAPQCAQLQECMAQLARDPGDERRCMLRGVGRRDGAAVWWRAVLTRAGERHDGYSLVLTDVTDLEINRRELAADVDLLEALLDVAGVEFFEWQSGRSVRCSAGYRALVGAQMPADLSDTLEEWVARIHPDDRERVQARWRDAPSGQLLPDDYRVVGDDGRVRWLRSAAIVRRDESGALEHMSGVVRDVSAEHEARRLLAERAALAEFMPDFLMRVATDGRITYLNAVAERFFTESAMQGLPTHLGQIHYVHHNQERVQHDLRAVIEHGQPTRFSLIGETHPERPVFDVLATPLRDCDGKVSGVLIAARDVSRLVRAEVEARTALRRLQTLLETTHACVVMADAEGRVTLVNRAFCGAIGLSPETALGLSMQDFCFPEDAEARRASLRALFLEGAVSFNWRMRKANGEACWFRVDASMVGTPAEGRREFVFIGTDIHRAEQERAAMVERERWLDLVLSDARIGAFRFNRETRSGELVGAYASLYRQTTPHVVMPDELYSMILPEQRDAIWRQTLEFLKHDGRTTIDYPLELPDGARRWLRAYLRNEGAYLSNRGILSSVVMDITEDRERAAEREELQRQVYQAQKAESLGVMAGGIAHDLNNMLMAAIGQLNLAVGAVPANSQLEQYLGTVESVLGRMEGLTERMLAYAGKSASRMEQVDVAALFDSMEPLLRASAGRHTRLRVDIETRPLLVRGDETQIEQVVLNLVQNAVDAMAEQGGTMRLRLSRVAGSDVRSAQLQWPLAPAEHYLELMARDDGPGIPEATLRRIFEPFYTTKTTGRGLGLPVVQGIVKAHQGSIRVLSEVGIGTEFRVYLPLLPDAEISVPVADDRGAEVQTPLNFVKPPLIAIDDDEDVLAVTSAMLEQCGYEVMAYLSGDDGIADVLANPDRYGVAVIDLTMPVKDGVTVARDLRMIVPDLPILFVSGYSKEQAADLMAPDERTAFLRKPFRIDALQRALELLLMPPAD